MILDIDIVGKNITNKNIDWIVSTPLYISKYMVENSNIDINTTIIDPCVWHGVFPLAILFYIEKNISYLETNYMTILLIK